jgi:alpha-L-rhamnosidase
MAEDFHFLICSAGPKPQWSLPMKHNNFTRRHFLEIAALTPFATLVPRKAVFAEEKEPTPEFTCAKSVWAAGREQEMNVSLIFFADVDIVSPAGVILRCAGSTVMRIWVNNEFAGYGPARGPHGWFRVDEWNLSSKLRRGRNTVQIEISGYNSNSFYHLDQPSFLRAEVIDAEGKVLAATAADQNAPFPIFSVIDQTGRRVQKVQRFSFQRPFIEVYDFRRQYGTVTLAEEPEVKYLPRRVPYPEFALFEPKAWLRREKLSPTTVDEQWRDRALTGIGSKLKGYEIDELEILLSDEVQKLGTERLDRATPLREGTTYKENDAQLVDFGLNLCGFFGFELQQAEPGTEILLTFDEILMDDGELDFHRLSTCSAIKWTLNGDENRIEAFEPHVGRYAKIHCLKGSFKLKRFYLREYAHPEIRDASFTCSDPRLEKLFRAGVLTFRENAVDVFTDCPHRERAGWLCDSFFTARSAFNLTGIPDIEDAFYENYMLPESFKCIPDGMLPMCYPADHYDGIYIPNWSLWFVIELSEYARRGADPAILAGLKTKVEKLMKFFARYENSDGLLEKLESWVFVEWSKANDFVQDVNYPSNMLYAAALDAAGKLYDHPEWSEKARAIRKTINAQSFDGEFFIDNAIRKDDGTLEVTRNRSEVCQYFAFFFETVTPESHPKLWKTLLDEFGPNRVKEGKYPDIHKANSFVGNVLRLELLSHAGRGTQLLEESVAYNEYMADRTGTLWENDGAYASCNHGFASHICHVLLRDVVGIADVDVPTKTIKISFQDIPNLERASGVHPVAGGVVSLSWEKKNGEFSYKLNVPEGWKTVLTEK